ncbi:glycosyltransferase [Alteromonas ponticola]|uniref:Glycosyltransferase n=1 Tax=Alteromonas ponticola TaxID=2720613 RepID=A0ABX1R150_9ALTE|nr:glycosyltransferase [Alteromonas ponticola]NMH60195.1 glycosyltransferase [Alteromonas ponticola]
MTSPHGFDPNWYLTAYPDVAESGQDPYLHYILHGAQEGRLPIENPAQAFEKSLWAGAYDIALCRLQKIAFSTEHAPIVCSYANWACARWFSHKGDFEAAYTHLQAIIASEVYFPAHAGVHIGWVDSLIRTSRCEEAMNALTEWSNKIPPVDWNLLRCNLAMQTGESDSVKLKWLNQIFGNANLAALSTASNNALSIDNLSVDMPLASTECPLVSVIVPVFNAEKCVTTALRALNNQDWGNLEIIIVDDCSTDASIEVIEAFMLSTEASARARVFRLVKQAENCGAYASRNLGASLATGDFLTVHDADDWSHPQKISKQVKDIQRTGGKASISHWVRCSTDLEFSRWRYEESLVHLNISSLMITRQALEIVGYWDQIKAGADTEFYYRLQAVFGANAVVETMPDVPLSFGRNQAGSLTQTESTHFRSQFYGIRKDYIDSFTLWHDKIRSGASAYIPLNLNVRRFPAPTELVRGQLHSEESSSIEDFIRYSGLWDAGWYLSRYPELQGVLIEPIKHFLAVGIFEGRDPSPNLSLSLAAFKAGLKCAHIDDTFLFEVFGEQYDRSFNLLGDQPLKSSCNTVLLIGHAVGEKLYGAERSLLDLIHAYKMLDINVVVALPSAINHPYIEEIKTLVSVIAVIPDGWWQMGKLASTETLSHYSILIKEYKIDFVHCNSTVVEGGALVANQLDVPLILHCRELLGLDTQLQETLNATEMEWIARCLSMADVIITNSQFVFNKWLNHYLCQMGDHRDAPHLIEVTNRVEISKLIKLPLPDFDPEHRNLRVGMISSNTEKKGIRDFFALSELCGRAKLNVDFVCYGPESGALKSLMSTPSLVTFGGYVAEPQLALKELDIVLSLSKVEETFGRTVAEALASGRVPISYKLGGITELIEQSDSGFLVEEGSLNQIVTILKTIIDDPALLVEHGNKGRLFAQENFSLRKMVNQLEIALGRLNLNGSKI